MVLRTLSHHGIAGDWAGSGSLKGAKTFRANVLHIIHNLHKSEQP